MTPPTERKKKVFIVEYLENKISKCIVVEKDVLYPGETKGAIILIGEGEK